MAEGTKEILANTVKPFRPQTSSTQKIFASNGSGGTPRAVSAHDSATRRQIEQGRALGRDLSPGMKVGAQGRDLSPGVKEGA